MDKDSIYADHESAAGPFEFNEAVARVFPDMLRRSIPGYAASIQAIGVLAARYVRPDTRCYDLGCSLGAATLAMRRNIEATGCRIVAIDNAPAMVERCRDAVAADQSDSSVEIAVVEGDIRDINITRASMAVMNYTLQFLPVEERDDMIARIHTGMVDGGVLVVSEKIVDDDPEVEHLMVELHRDFKRRNAYSDMEISRKRTALENILVPETLGAHERRLRDAGFRHVGVWLKYFNFLSLVAIR